MPVCEKCGDAVFSIDGEGQWICQKCTDVERLSVGPLGFDVRMQFKASAPYCYRTLTYHNVDKVHYGYWPFEEIVRVTLESSVHGTRATFPVDYIAEFTVTPATELAEEF